MIQKHSFKYRLTLYYSLSFLLLLVILGVVSYSGLEQVLIYNLDKNINIVASSEADFATHTDHLHLHNIQDVLPGSPSTSNALKRFAQITDLKGQLLVANHTLKTAPLPLKPEALNKNAQGIPFYVSVQYNNQPYRMLYLPFSKAQSTYSLQVATPLTPIINTLNAMLKIYILSSFLTLVLATMIGYFLAKQAISPITMITNKAKTISLTNLGDRIVLKNKSQDELTQLADVLNHMLKRLDHSVQTLQQFTTDASHELRTPLSILKGEIQVALRKERSIEEYQHILISSLEEVNRLIKLSESLLLLSQIESSSSEHKVISELNPLIDQMVKRFKSRVDKKSIDLKVNLSNSPNILIPDTDLLQVLTNLVDNALKATSNGGQIILSSKLVNQSCEISVQDSGKGISEKDKPLIFERFYQVDNARSENRENFGIGLSICQSIVEKHGGHIKVTSQINKGSTFTVSLPIAKNS